MLPAVLCWLCIVPREQAISRKSFCCPNPVCFLCVPKGQKAKQLVPFWHAGGKALAMKSESLMHHDEMESSTHGIRKDIVSKKNHKPNTSAF